MTAIKYSEAAALDIEGIGDYISDEQHRPGAALKMVESILDAIDKLADFPHLGAPLTARVGVDTDYRYLVCNNYLVFYRLLDDKVFIDRVLHGKRDYVSILFDGRSTG